MEELAKMRKEKNELILQIKNLQVSVLHNGTVERSQIKMKLNMLQISTSKLDSNTSM